MQDQHKPINAGYKKKKKKKLQSDPSLKKKKQFSLPVSKPSL